MKPTIEMRRRLRAGTAALLAAALALPTLAGEGRTARERRTVTGEILSFRDEDSSFLLRRDPVGGAPAEEVSVI